MKKLWILALVVAFGATSCSSDEDPKPEETIVGNWVGQRAKLIVYAENGEDISSELNISLEEPNKATAVFNSDKSFEVDVKLTSPIPVVEHKAGTYEVGKDSLILNIEGENPNKIAYSLQADQLEVTLGTPKVSILKYTFKRQVAPETKN